MISPAAVHSYRYSLFCAATTRFNFRVSMKDFLLRRHWARPFFTIWRGVLFDTILYFHAYWDFFHYFRYYLRRHYTPCSHAAASFSLFIVVGALLIIWWASFIGLPQLAAVIQYRLPFITCLGLGWRSQTPSRPLTLLDYSSSLRLVPRLHDRSKIQCHDVDFAEHSIPRHQKLPLSCPDFGR